MGPALQPRTQPADVSTVFPLHVRPLCPHPLRPGALTRPNGLPPSAGAIEGEETEATFPAVALRGVANYILDTCAFARVCRFQNPHPSTRNRELNPEPYTINSYPATLNPKP